MSILQLIVLAVGLSMDAFAVSICKGLQIKSINYNKSIKIALYFGLFQGLMPLIGYLLGNIFKDVIINLDHWLAFGLLTFIGINLIKENNTNLNINDKIDSAHTAVEQLFYALLSEEYIQSLNPGYE